MRDGARIGRLRLDVLVDNAGSYDDAGSIHDQSVESWRRAIDVDLASAFHCSKPVAARMVEQGDGGAIVNIASVDGLLPCTPEEIGNAVLFSNLASYVTGQNRAVDGGWTLV